MREYDWWKEWNYGCLGWFRLHVYCISIYLFTRFSGSVLRKFQQILHLYCRSWTTGERCNYLEWCASGARFQAGCRAHTAGLAGMRNTCAKMECLELMMFWCILSPKKWTNSCFVSMILPLFGRCSLIIQDLLGLRASGGCVEVATFFHALAVWFFLNWYQWITW